MRTRAHSTPVGNAHRRNTRIDAKGFCILCYDGGGAYDATMRDPNAVKDARVRADPYIVLDDDAVAIAALARDQVSSVAVMKIVGHNDDVRRNLYVVADTDASITVQNGEGVNCDPISKSDGAPTSIKAGKFVDGAIGAEQDATAPRLHAGKPVNDRPGAYEIAGMDRGQLGSPAAQAKPKAP
jgi:hypothetical protein